MPLLRRAQEVLRLAFGDDYEALGEAQFYLALAEVADCTEASLPSVDSDLIQVRCPIRSSRAPRKPQEHLSYQYQTDDAALTISGADYAVQLPEWEGRFRL